MYIASTAIVYCDHAKSYCCSRIQIVLLQDLSISIVAQFHSRMAFIGGGFYSFQFLDEWDFS